ncbi:MAG: type II toxin-antitoxin system RelE/ParE family toxin [Sulfuricaulis sp.]|uniref:type II toxin-antitoxin system RelE/ParE family toxin n=1 Tax=Sulfuricaulis sp. TaxID=2003553 RepID=UPI0034A45AD1
MTWEVEYTDEFGAWWEGLDEGTQIAIDAAVRLLETKGPQLPFPYSSDARGSRFGQMRELRIQYKGEPYRVLYAFDPRRTAVLLIGGNKGGNDRWYEEFVPRADKLYEDHLATLAKEGSIHGKKV